jgi:hypothetical protein
LEKMSAVLVAAGDPLDRGHVSAGLREALLPHLDQQEAASLDAMMRRLDALAEAVVAKVRQNTGHTWQCNHYCTWDGARDRAPP